MPALEGIPADVLMEAIKYEDAMEVPNIVKMTRSECDEEILDLYQEKRFLIAAVQYLKERLINSQKPN